MRDTPHHKYSNLIRLRPAVIYIKRGNCRSFNQLSDIARRHLKEHVSTKVFPVPSLMEGNAEGVAVGAMLSSVLGT